MLFLTVSEQLTKEEVATVVANYTHTGLNYTPAVCTKSKYALKIFWDSILIRTM